MLRLGDHRKSCLNSIRQPAEQGERPRPMVRRPLRVLNPRRVLRDRAALTGVQKPTVGDCQPASDTSSGRCSTSGARCERSRVSRKAAISSRFARASSLPSAISSRVKLLSNSK